MKRQRGHGLQPCEMGLIGVCMESRQGLQGLEKSGRDTMTRMGLMASTTSGRALGATENGGHHTGADLLPIVTDFSKVEAVDSCSILGAHDGILPDDLMDLLDSAPA